MTPQQRDHWCRISSEGVIVHGSVWWAVLELLDQVDALERNRTWGAEILEKELACREATIRSVIEALKA